MRRRQRERKSYAPIGTCAIVFSSEETWGNTVAHLLAWLRPFLLLMRLFSLTMHHSVLLPSSSVTGRSLYCHCAFFLLYPLCTRSLRLTLLMFPAPLHLLPHVSAPCLCMSVHGLTFFFSCPVLSASFSLSPLPPRLTHEDSAPAEVDELPEPQ